MNKDKKKMIVVGALAVLIVGVGAFQVVSSNSAPPAPVKEATAKTTETDEAATNGTDTKAPTGTSAEYAADSEGDGEVAQGDASKETDPMRQLYSMNLAARDPFDTIIKLPTIPEPKVAVNPEPPKGQGGYRGGDMSMPPFDPLKGTLPEVGGPGTGQPPMNIVPQGPAYSASGVIRGDKNAAVIADAQGNQRLVYEGQAIDSDHRVVSVQKGKVVIRKKDGKTITLSVGGNP